jgi:hypothetical protein
MYRVWLSVKMTGWGHTCTKFQSHCSPLCGLTFLWLLPQDLTIDCTILGGNGHWTCFCEIQVSFLYSCRKSSPSLFIVGTQPQFNRWCCTPLVLPRPGKEAQVLLVLCSSKSVEGNAQNSFQKDCLTMEATVWIGRVPQKPMCESLVSTLGL